MLKSSSLCLNSSNLGNFWLKIEQFWPFEEISIFSHGGHLGYRTALTSPFFSIFSLAAILVGSRDDRTQFWKGAIQGSFHKSLVAIGPVVSEEKIFFLISSPFFF
jgi:hypothetical protein